MPHPADHSARQADEPIQQFVYSGKDRPSGGLPPGPEDLPPPLPPDMPGSDIPPTDLPEIDLPDPVENPPFGEEDPAEDLPPLDPATPVEMPDIVPVPTRRDQTVVR